jgi:drug/metabolite transporter (DMT)-like permease
VRTKIAVLTALALAGFAGNSLLCRLALAGGEIDAASFTAIRLASGAIVLAGLAMPRGGGAHRAGSWGSAAALFVYAAPFSYAYLELGAGVGALILFGAVQTTMLGVAIARGERPRPRVWLGLAIALGGLVGLAAPGATAPAPLAAALMAAAGIAWGVYSLRGRGVAGDPLVATAGNFLRAAPLGLALVAVAAAIGALGPLAVSREGVALAIASGALASGVGYSLWYAALRGLAATEAAVVQLLTPVLAAAGGVALLGESISARLALAAAAILGGVGLALRR